MLEVFGESLLLEVKGCGYLLFDPIVVDVLFSLITEESNNVFNTVLLL